MLFGGLDTTPLRSLLSKLVEPNEYGKIYTLAGIAFTLAGFFTSSAYQEIYADTVTYWPGFVYLIGSSVLFIALVSTLAGLNVRCHNLSLKKDIFLIFRAETSNLFQLQTYFIFFLNYNSLFLRF